MTGTSAGGRWTTRLPVAVVALFLALPAIPAFADEGEPEACFTFSPSSPATGDTVTFDASCSSDPNGSIVSRAWDLQNDRRYDDGGGLTASHSFATSGTYTVRLRVTDDDGDSDSSSRTITVRNRPPVASFAVNPSSPLSLEQVTFTSTSSDPDGTITSRHWDLDNDGSFDDGNSGTATRTFATPGDYTVRLRVIDNKGAEDIEQVVVGVRNRAPSAVFSRTPAAPLSRTAVNFTSTSSDPDGTVASQTWDLDNDGDFDDGSGATAQHTFNTPGDHVVRLRVVDNRGAETVATTTVAVANRAPSAAFTHGPSSPLGAETVTFTSSASDLDGTLASETWDLDADGEFDDGNGSTASRSFPRPGDYTVSLRVVDNLGAAMIATRTVTVGNRLPSAGFSFGPDSPLSDDEVTFTSSAADQDGSVEEQVWDLDDDGQFDDASGASATRAFPAGEHRVALRVTDDFGGVATESQTVRVGARPAPPESGGQAGTAAESFDDSTPVGTVPTPGPVGSPVDELRSIVPFPIVRIRGRTDPRGARVSLLAVRAPAGVKVTLRCRGVDCPAPRAVRRVTTAGTKATGSARFRRFETHLRAGTVLEIFATQPGRLGKYTRFTIRRLLPPRRKDRCVMPGTLRAASCQVAP
jgi:PKD repeat protein